MASILGRILEELDTLANKECRGDVSEEVKGRYDAFAKAADVVREQRETEEQSRQRFETWVTTACGGTAYTFRQRDGKYSNTWVADSWEAWQASQTFTEASE